MNYRPNKILSLICKNVCWPITHNLLLLMNSYNDKINKKGYYRMDYDKKMALLLFDDYPVSMQMIFVNILICADVIPKWQASGNRG